MDVAIQRATLDKAESFWKALDAVARERRYLAFLQAPPIESTVKFVAECSAKGGSQFFAIHAGQVVGWCDVIRNERAGMTHAGTLGLAVLPPYRGRKVGRRLAAATIDDAMRKGIERIELEVFASNANAIALYRRLGFVEEGRKRRARCVDGAYDDVLVMALLKPDAERSAPPPAGAGGARCC